ncbi:MAG: glycosyltransferase family 4 protein [Nitrososphaerota archaeon]|nr:glycosyltransferase family 4 protein [Nitrososphaerota archaeon]
MKILWMNHRDIANPKAGGAERTIYEIGRRLVLHGHEVDVLAGGWPGAMRHETIDGVRFHRYGNRVAPHLVHPFFLMYHSNADVIVDDMAHAAPWCSPWFSKKPGVVFFRHMHARTLKGQVTPYMAQTLTFLERHYSFFYKTWPFVTESSSSERDLNSLGVGSHRIIRIPPGVDTELFRPRAKTVEPSMVYFGGMRPYKRPEHALFALSILRNKGCRVHLTMIGDGPSLSLLKNLSFELGVHKDVSFVGRVPDERLSDIVSSSWVNLHCSFSEGWGLSVVESAAAGTPTVAYRVPGVSESVVEGKNGVLVEDGNVKALSNAVSSVIQAKGSMAETCRLTAEGYSWGRTSRNWETMLLELTCQADPFGERNCISKYS